MVDIRALDHLRRAQCIHAAQRGLASVRPSDASVRHIHSVSDGEVQSSGEYWVLMKLSTQAWAHSGMDFDKSKLAFSLASAEHRATSGRSVARIL